MRYWKLGIKVCPDCTMIRYIHLPASALRCLTLHIPTFMPSCAYFYLPLPVYAYLCMCMSVYACLCLSMPVYVCLCLSMPIYACLVYACLLSVPVYACRSVPTYACLCLLHPSSNQSFPARAIQTGAMVHTALHSHSSHLLHIILLLYNHPQGKGENLHF